MGYVSIIFPSGISADFAPAFEEAAEFWNKAIASGLPPTTFERNFRPFLCRLGVPYTFEAGDTINGLAIFSQVNPIDGPGQILGQAGPCYLEGEMPYLGTMRFDSADSQGLVDAGQFKAVIIHEMGHVVGIGGLWGILNLVRDPCRNAPCNTNPTYVGAGGMEGFKDLGGQGVVPVGDERGPGTWNAHWRDRYFVNELMTGFLNSNSPNPLSIMSVKSLRDLGYQENLAASEDYEIPSEFARPLGGVDFPLVGEMLELNPIQLKDAIREQAELEDSAAAVTYKGEFAGVILMTLFGFVALAALVVSNARAQRRMMERMNQLPTQQITFSKNYQP